MVEVNSRATLIDYCKRKLGWPVITLNIDDDQIEDRIDEAFQFWQQYHYDAIQKTYLSHQITETDVTNKYVTIPDTIVAVRRIFSLASSSTTQNMFDIRYQMRLQDIQALTSAQLSYYAISQHHLAMIDLILQGQIPIDFNQHMNRVYVNMDWTEVNTGEYMLFEVSQIVDPETFTDVYNDMMLKRYATALIKKQWATNLKKFGNVPIPGLPAGLQGPELYEEAVKEVDEIEESIMEDYQEPAMMFMG